MKANKPSSGKSDFYVLCIFKDFSAMNECLKKVLVFVAKGEHAKYTLLNLCQFKQSNRLKFWIIFPHFERVSQFLCLFLIFLFPYTKRRSQQELAEKL